MKYGAANVIGRARAREGGFSFIAPARRQLCWSRYLSPSCHHGDSAGTLLLLLTQYDQPGLAWSRSTLQPFDCDQPECWSATHHVVAAAWELLSNSPVVVVDRKKKVKEQSSNCTCFRPAYLGHGLRMQTFYETGGRCLERFSNLLNRFVSTSILNWQQLLCYSWRKLRTKCKQRIAATRHNPYQTMRLRQ